MARNMNKLRSSISSPHLTDDILEPIKIKLKPDLLPQQTFTQATRKVRKKEETTRNYRICILSDFFFPKKGGVETHMYNLA